MSIRKSGSLVAGTLLVLGTAIGIAPSAGAAPMVDQQRAVTFTCTGSDAGQTVVSPTDFTVSYPEVVAPGEFFTVSVQPGPMRNNTRTIGRVTFDYALPTNADIIDVRVAGGGQGLSGDTPSAVRVNAATKNLDAAGTVARVWGGQSARFGANQGTGNTNGLRVAANTDFRLPQLDIVLRAPAGPGTEITTGLPGSGVEHSGNGTAESTDLQWVRDRSSIFGSYGPAQCSADAGSSVLTSTVVGDLEPVLLPTSTTLTVSPDVLGPNQPATLTAQVGSEHGVLSSFTDGQVEFRDADSGAVLETAPVGADGTASAAHVFPPVTGDTAVTVIAEYTGAPGGIAPSTSAPVTVTSTGDPTIDYDTRLDLIAHLGDETDTEAEVTVVATIDRPAGPPIPEQATVQLYRNGTPIGEPRSLPAGDQITWDDLIERAPRTATYTYHVEFVDTIVDYELWTGGTSAPVSVIVSGTNPALDPPILGDSGSLGEIFGGLFGSLGG